MWLRKPSSSSVSIRTGWAELFPSHLLMARNCLVPTKKPVNRCLTRFNLSQYQASDSTETFCLRISQPAAKARSEGHSKTGANLSVASIFDAHIVECVRLGISIGFQVLWKSRRRSGRVRPPPGSTIAVEEKICIALVVLGIALRQNIREASRVLSPCLTWCSGE